MNILKATLCGRMSFLFLLLFSVSGLFAQDIHFSQFQNAHFQRSPALTGVFEGDTRYVVNYRAQWYDVPITYRTVNGHVDKRFTANGTKSNYFSGGIVFNYDHAGDAKLSNAQLGLNGSYTHKITRSHYLTVGLQLAGYQRAFSDVRLRFDEQYNGKIYDATILHTENFDSKSVFYADFSAGANWHIRSNKSKTRSNGSPRLSRTHVDIGFGIFHINRPDRNFYDQEDFQYPIRMDFYGLGTFEIAQRWDFLLNIMGQYQNPYREHVATGAFKYHFDDKLAHERAIGFGLGYRFNNGLGAGDALIPYFQLNINAWQFGLSYDLNISEFEVATNGLGGPEFSLIYIFRKAITEPFCPTCPPYL